MANAKHAEHEAATVALILAARRVLNAGCLEFLTDRQREAARNAIQAGTNAQVSVDLTTRNVRACLIPASGVPITLFRVAVDA